MYSFFQISLSNSPASFVDQALNLRLVEGGLLSRRLEIPFFNVLLMKHQQA